MSIVDDILYSPVVKSSNKVYVLWHGGYLIRYNIIEECFLDKFLSLEEANRIIQTLAKKSHYYEIRRNDDPEVIAYMNRRIFTVEDDRYYIDVNLTYEEAFDKLNKIFKLPYRNYGVGVKRSIPLTLP